MVYFLVNLCYHYFATARKKGPRLKWTIYRHKSDKNKKSLYVSNFGILYVVVCSKSTAYTSFWKCLKYLLKISCFIQDYYKLHDFLILKTLCMGRSKILRCVWKKLTSFAFGSTYLHQTFTEFLSNPYTNFNISIRQI